MTTKNEELKAQEAEKREEEARKAQEAQAKKDQAAHDAAVKKDYEESQKDKVQAEDVKNVPEVAKVSTQTQSQEGSNEHQGQGAGHSLPKRADQHILDDKEAGAKARGLGQEPNVEDSEANAGYRYVQPAHPPTKADDRS